MSTTKLPEHIGGYQHLQPDVVSREDDIYVLNGSPVSFVGQMRAGYPVGQLEGLGYRIYRKYPYPRQGGDRALTQEEKDNLARVQADLAHNEVARAQQAQAAELARQALHDQKPGVIVARALGCNTLPSDAKARKGIPIATGFIDYFPLAIAEVAAVSKAGNEQHNPGTPLHWDRSKSGDESDALMRHFVERGTRDSDGLRHSAKLAWRAMALLQKELENERRT